MTNYSSIHWFDGLNPSIIYLMSFDRVPRCTSFTAKLRNIASKLQIKKNNNSGCFTFWTRLTSLHIHKHTHTYTRIMLHTRAHTYTWLHLFTYVFLWRWWGGGGAKEHYAEPNIGVCVLVYGFSYDRTVFWLIDSNVFIWLIFFTWRITSTWCECHNTIRNHSHRLFVYNF